MKYNEINFDGLIGPSHNYAGLAVGNLASTKNAQHTSNPKQAALQGLEKMRTLIKLGYSQGFLLPQERPRVDMLYRLGFTGSAQAVVAKAAKTAPELLPMIYSASCMWAANAATVTPSPDSDDQRVHFTPANLLTSAHRSIEHTETFQCLRTVFNNEKHFAVHSALPQHTLFADEGAANHTRLCADYGSQGVGVFVYGRNGATAPTRFPARQTLQASQAVARQHGVGQAVFLQQNPIAIDAGAFHNDVVAVGNGPVFFYHEEAFDAEQKTHLAQQMQAIKAGGIDFKAVQVPSSAVSLSDAIKSYLFNSQLLAAPDGDMREMHLIAPMECQQNTAVRNYLDALVQEASQPIRKVTFVDVTQSMSNGGGPACLRLRVALSEQQQQAVDQRFLLDEAKIDRLQAWVNQYYRDRIAPADLADASLLDENYTALSALTTLLDLGHYYDFQKN